MSETKTWQRITKPGQVKVGDELRFTIGDQKLSKKAKLIIAAGTDREEIIYNKSRNYYLITSMAINNEGSQKNVEFLESEQTDIGTLEQEIRQVRARLARVEQERDSLMAALDDAATSLETIQLRSYGEESCISTMQQVRGYAGARAGVARKDIAASKADTP